MGAPDSGGAEGGLARRVLVLAGAVAVLAVAAVVAAQRVAIADAWWAWTTARPLSASQQERLERCEDEPSWLVLGRLLEQDLAAPCGERWVVDALARRVSGEGHARHLTQVAADPARPASLRLRAGLALELGGRVGPVEVSRLASDPALPVDRWTWLLGALGSGALDGGWADPWLTGQVALQRFAEGEPEVTAEVARRLRWSAAHDGPRDRHLTGARVLRGLGLDEGRLQAQRERRRRGAGLWALPASWVRHLLSDPDTCADEASPSCLRALALVAEEAAAEARVEVGAVRAAAELPEIEPLVTVLYAREPLRAAASLDELGAWATWVAEAPEQRRAARLLAAVASPEHRFGPGPLQEGAVGDPVHAVRLGRSDPWTSALGAVGFARVAGVEVEIQETGASASISVGTRSALVGPCGSAPVGPPAGGAPRSVEEVLARAALEAAGARDRAGDAAGSARLVGLAARLDPKLEAPQGADDPCAHP